MPLTDPTIRKAVSRDKPYKLADSGGLFIYVTPAGGKLWRLKYRYGGKERLESFGPYPAVTLAKAREQRDALKELLIAGIDPVEHKKARERAKAEAREQTFEVQAREWCAHMYGTWKPRHHDNVLAYFERDVFPAIGSRPISEIGAPEIKRVIKAVEKRGALDIARRIAFRIGAVFKFARINGYCENNPAEGLSSLVKPRKTTHYASLKETDLPDFLRALAAFRGYRLTQLAMRFVLHTVVRSTELRGARWKEFDLEAKIWRIPAERMKMNQEHLVPLSRQTLAILAQIRELTGDRPLLFPNRNKPDQPMSENTVNQAIADMGFKGRATGHGFRSTFSTILNERGVNRDWIERQLAHAERDEVRGAYNSAEYLEQRRGVMQHWSDILTAMEKGQKVPKLRRVA